MIKKLIKITNLIKYVLKLKFDQLKMIKFQYIHTTLLYCILMTRQLTLHF